MQIKTHQKGDSVELQDGSRWCIWRPDMYGTLQWSPSTDLNVIEIEITSPRTSSSTKMEGVSASSARMQIGSRDECMAIRSRPSEEHAFSGRAFSSTVRRTA